MLDKKYSFIKEERLFLQKEISALFADGKRFSSHSFSIVWRIRQDNHFSAPCILISVPKHRFKRAVDRNYLKRRIKEAYRLNKHIIYDLANRHTISVHIGFIYRDSRKKSFRQIEENILHSLNTLASKIAEKFDDR